MTKGAQIRRPRAVVGFLEQVRGDGFAGVVRGERDRTPRDLSSRCCYLPVASTKARGTANPTNSLLSHALIRLRKTGLAQRDENCGTKSSNPLLSTGESATNRSGVGLRWSRGLFVIGAGTARMFAEAPSPVCAPRSCTFRSGIAPRPARSRNFVAVPIHVVPTILRGRAFRR
jgi:hypothetical protein